MIFPQFAPNDLTNRRPHASMSGEINICHVFELQAPKGLSYGPVACIEQKCSECTGVCGKRPALPILKRKRLRQGDSAPVFRGWAALNLMMRCTVSSGCLCRFFCRIQQIVPFRTICFSFSHLFQKRSVLRPLLKKELIPYKSVWRICITNFHG